MLQKNEKNYQTLSLAFLISFDLNRKNPKNGEMISTIQVKNTSLIFSDKLPLIKVIPP